VRLTLSFILVIALLLSLSAAQAVMYSYVDEYGRLHFTNVPADPRFKEIPGFDQIRELAEHVRYSSFINSAAKRYNLAPELIQAVIKIESGFNPFAISEKGAMGLMQLMPDTADDMRVGDPFDPEENILGGTRYLSLLLKRFNQDKRLAVAAYNVGPTTVAKHDAVPPIPQTRQFVDRVMRFYREFEEKGD